MPAKLAQHLVSRGLLLSEKVDEALRQRAVAGGTLDTVLLEQGLISEAGILQALSDVSGHRLVNLADFEPNAEVATLIPPKIAERMGIVPLSVDEDSLHVACSYPVPTSELNEVGFLLGKRLELWIAIEARIRDWVSTIYKTPLPQRYVSLLSTLDPQRGSTAHTQAPPPAPPQQAPEPVSVEDEVGGDEASLEETLTRDMVERLAMNVIEEPIPLEVRKAPRNPDPPRSPAVNPIYDRIETTSVDASGYAAFARESSKSPAVPAVAVPSVPSPPPPRIAPVPVRARTEPAVPAAPTRPEFRLEPPPATPRPPPHQEPPRPLNGAAFPREPVPPPPDHTVPDWNLAQARSALKTASTDRDRIIEVALRFARKTFEYAAAFAVVRGAAVGWDARGEGADKAQLTQLSIPLDAASVFRTVAITRGSYVGPLPPDTLSKQYLELLHRSPRTVFLYPVEVKGRLVAILYGDSGQGPVSQRRLSDFILFCQELSSTFHELIARRKQRASGGGEGLLDGFGLSSRGLPGPAASVGWSPSAASHSSALGRAASIPGLAFAEGERPPPDFAPLLRRLTGPDAAARARAMAELARTPEASAEVLARQFPGPTAWTRMTVSELPEADELGPIPAALARLGRPAAKALAPLLDSSDSDTRYLALLTAGNLPFPELVDGILRGLFDLEPDISSSARAAATALRRVPRFDAAMRGLRQELAASDPLRRSLAARALGVLHDREAVDGLIGMTGSDDLMCAQAAAEALKEITRATFGTNPREWTAWWADNRDRRRAQWLVTALRSRELEVRNAAIDELARAVGEPLGYAADAPELERENAVRRWEQLIQDTPRGRRLEL